MNAPLFLPREVSWRTLIPKWQPQNSTSSGCAIDVEVMCTLEDLQMMQTARNHAHDERPPLRKSPPGACTLKG
eukprot:7583062-Pyramimonas_sp.AAC.1